MSKDFVKPVIPLLSFPTNSAATSALDNVLQDPMINSNDPSQCDEETEFLDPCVQFTEEQQNTVPVGNAISYSERMSDVSTPIVTTVQSSGTFDGKKYVDPSLTSNKIIVRSLQMPQEERSQWSTTQKEYEPLVKVASSTLKFQHLATSVQKADMGKTALPQDKKTTQTAVKSKVDPYNFEKLVEKNSSFHLARKMQARPDRLEQNKVTGFTSIKQVPHTSYFNSHETRGVTRPKDTSSTKQVDTSYPFPSSQDKLWNNATTEEPGRSQQQWTSKQQKNIRSRTYEPSDSYVSNKSMQVRRTTEYSNGRSQSDAVSKSQPTSSISRLQLLVCAQSMLKSVGDLLLAVTDSDMQTESMTWGNKQKTTSYFKSKQEQSILSEIVGQLSTYQQFAKAALSTGNEYLSVPATTQNSEQHHIQTLAGENDEITFPSIPL